VQYVSSGGDRTEKGEVVFSLRKLSVGLVVMAVAASFAAVSSGASDKNSSAGSKTVKVAFIETDPLSGSGWTQSWNQARLQLVAKLHVATTSVGPVAENNAVATQATDLISRGYNVIVAEDFAYQPFLYTVAQKNPNIKFILIGPDTQSLLPNFATVYGNLWQVRYVEGVLAAYMDKTNKLGFVTAHTIPSVVAGINGFVLGAQSVKPKIKTTVVSTGSWYDPSGTTQAAETLAAGGAGVIAQHEDDTGSLLGADHAGVWGMGSETNTSAAAPKTYLSGSVYNWGPYLINQVRDVMNGTWKASNYSGDLSSGLVALGPINSAVPARIVQKVQKVEAAIKSGSLQVFKGPIIDNNGTVMVRAGKTLTSPSAIYAKQTQFVRGVVGKIGS
jgi:basic membrane protein A